MLSRCGIGHQVLNAKYHESEAEIVAQAGRKSMVTIATNMAGRGTDIILGGNPEFMAWADLKREADADGRPKYPTRLEVPPEVWKNAVEKYEPAMKEEGRGVAGTGGLHIIGTERHESRRIDNQLRGRAGRQGDPGSSRFFLSLEDELMRKFAGEWVAGVLTRLGMQEGEAIESPMVSRRIEGAQKKVEERNFDARKSLLEYDEVMDEQRKRIYSFRQSILDGAPTKDAIIEMIDVQLKRAIDRFLADDYGPASFADYAGTRLGIELEAKDYKGAPFEIARENAIHEAESHAQEQIREAMEENISSDAESSEWNWKAMAAWANNRYGLNLKDRDLREFAKPARDADGQPTLDLDREALSEFLLEKAVTYIRAVDLGPAAEFLAPDWGRRSLASWVHHKFGLAIDPKAWDNLSRTEITAELERAVRDLYCRKEAEFPVQVGLTRYLAEKTQGGVPRYDRDGLATWASARFDKIIEADELRPLTKNEIAKLLAEIAGSSYKGADLAESLDPLLARAFPPPSGKHVPEPDAQALAELARWSHESLGVETTPDELRALGAKNARAKLVRVLDSRWRPELAELEKVLLLQILDNSWMEHLRTMDHLRSSVGLRGYAQVDPKVEYKREGMRIFDEMLTGVGDKVTDLIFRVENFDPDFLSYLGARWQLERARTIHEAAPSGLTDGPAPAASASTRGGVAAQAAATNTKTDAKKEPVRRTEKKVGRNDPCPCGSGKKFKNCCMHKTAKADPF
jgi:preprotein translocase subunit SecA